MLVHWPTTVLVSSFSVPSLDSAELVVGKMRPPTPAPFSAVLRLPF